MNFSTPEFLFFFLPVVLTVYYLIPVKFKNFWLLASSLLFYTWGAPSVIPWLIGLSFIDYALTPFIANPENGRRKLYLWIGVIANLLFLAFYKYSNFLHTELNSLLQSLGFEHYLWAKVALPIGVSFFTFQKISYLVDVYRNTASPSKSFSNYLLFVTLFPQLIAGPIVRYKDIAKQIEVRAHCSAKFLEGVRRFSIGMAKKILIADYVALIADTSFSQPSESLGFAMAWLGILSYAMQIYFDFSGYSDMAIGLGKMFGFDILENFNKPYRATSITDFWRRWHISLSRWMKDYLYIPLGGNRSGGLATYRNLWIVFALSGLWHGANWTFIVWGLYHGLFLVIDRLYWEDFSKKLPYSLNISLTFLLVLVGWVFFRADTLSHAFYYLQALFPVNVSPISETFVAYSSTLNNRRLITLLIALLVAFLPIANLLKRMTPKIDQAGSLSRVSLTSTTFILSLFLLTMSFISLLSSSYHPFIYFRF